MKKRVEKCPKCNTILTTLPEKNEPEGIRHDRYCKKCLTLFYSHKTGLEEIKKANKSKEIIINETTKVLEIYLKVAANIYHREKKSGIKVSKGRAKFRKDVTDSISFAISMLGRIDEEKIAKVVKETLDTWTTSHNVILDGKVALAICRYLRGKK